MMTKKQNSLIRTISSWLPWFALTILGLVFASESAQRALSDAVKDVKAHEESQDQQTEIDPTLSASQTLPIKGNVKIHLFSEAKNHLKTIYSKHQIAFYCPCRYKSLRQINFKTCNFESQNRDWERTNRIEWEHLVPAYELGHKLPEWKIGHSSCVTQKGKKYRGRKCAAKTSSLFQHLEADLHNIVPTIGEINALRSNLPMSELPNTAKTFGECDTKISQNYIEPRNEDKGFAARAYLYMDQTYPDLKLLDSHNKKMFERWDKKYPPNEFEIWRNTQIKIVQGNSNPFIDAHAKIKKKEEREAASAQQDKAI